MSTFNKSGTVQASYWMDGVQIERERFYAVACDPARSVVVEACAGAGKTWMLVSRILRALLEGCAPQDILAITFTRKAAAEMRQRLDEWLRQFTHASDEARQAELVARGLSVNEAARLSPALAGLRRRLLDAPRSVAVHTFHGWFSQLLRAAPMDLLGELGLPPDPSLLEDLDDLMPQVWRGFHTRVASDAALLADYTALVGALGRHSAQAWLQAAIGKRIEFELADAAGVLERSMPDFVELWPELAAWHVPEAAWRAPACQHALRELVRDWSSHKNKRPAEAARRMEAVLGRAGPGGDIEDRQAFAALREALFTKTGTLNKQLPEHPQLNRLADWLSLLQEARAQHEAWAAHAQAMRLSRVLLAEYASVKRQRGVADMADLERAALHMLRDTSLAGWVQERLDAQVRQVLIDEFQDTSPLQWQALQAWLAGYAGAGGGASGQQAPSVFIVGDPKQSIYRFRRAEPRVFLAAQDFVARGLGGALLACDHTRRNSPAVLDALNRVFASAQQQGQFPGFRAHTTEQEGRNDRTGVLVLPSVPRDTHAEDVAGGAPQARPTADAPLWRDSLTTPRVMADEVLRLKEGRQIAAGIQQLLGEGLPPCEIFVLARKREALRWVAEALRERQIAHVAPEACDLIDAPEVRDLLALLDALTVPDHDLSLAHALRSPLFGLSDAHLIELAVRVHARGGRQVGATWWEALQGWAADEAASVPPDAELVRAAALLRGWQQAARTLPPHDLLDRVLREGDLRARLARALPPALRVAALSHVDALMAQSLRLDGGRYATPYNFVRALRRRVLKLPVVIAADAVQLLTVHGAKGLEASVVFVADSDAAAAKPETHTLLIDWPVEAAHPTSCAFMRSESRPPPALREALQREQAARAREELNALYVAMTRAKARLVFSRTEPYRPSSTGGPTWWKRLADAGALDPEDVWQPAAIADDEGAVDATAKGPTASAADAWVQLLDFPTPPELPSAVPPTTVAAAATASDPAIRMGLAFHRMLQWLTALPVAEREPAWAPAWAAAVQEFALVGESAGLVAQAGRAVLNAPGLAHLLDPQQLAWAGNEVELGWQGRLLRLDRLVQQHPQDGGHWWVLDYKLESHPEQNPAYREQLAAYRQAAALAAGQAGSAPVRVAFITGQGRLVEIDEP